MPFFSELTDAKVIEAAQTSEMMHKVKGDVLIEKGAQGDVFCNRRTGFRTRTVRRGARRGWGVQAVA